MLKKLVVAFLLIAVAAPAFAAKPVPFGYTEGPNGTTLFYKATCPAAPKEPNRKWQLAALVYPHGAIASMWGPAPGCWTRFTSGPNKVDTIEFCMIGKGDDGKLTMGNACMFGDPKAVYKGNPFPESAF